MTDIVKHAIHFATEAHQRIDQRRKYSGQPYAVHLDQVAKIVQSVSDDEEMIATAWLHDVVEDTPATLNDIEREFGQPVAQLVRELTDISKPSDGNRAARKKIDRQHLAEASARGQTIKLADLIDNCKDITKHDVKFARVYLDEMGALLEVLKHADEGLMRRAKKTLSKSLEQITRDPANTHDRVDESTSMLAFSSHFKRQYNGLFTARDIAEPLLSFDADNMMDVITEIFNTQNHQAIAVRTTGEITGFLTRDQIEATGVCGNYSRPFSDDQVLDGDASFAEVIHVLTRHDYCFISLIGQVQGVITRDDMNKPYMRMWLFGIITLSEMRITDLIKRYFSEEDWQALLPTGRIEAAQALHSERQRLNQHCELIDCLQLADKGLLLINDPGLLDSMGFSSRSAAKKVLKQVQSLRNNLAHAQDISTYDWAQIARLSQRMLD
ncbi:MAG: HD domain-containing protein [Gammaproteobacteria bacterium]|nr:HD domain-containing protein [Gammaproteobacteria bacterium]